MLTKTAAISIGRRRGVSSLLGGVALLAVSVIPCGCSSVQEYVQNGFKVGPNYAPQPASTAADWIDANDKRIHKDPDELAQWWTVFNDPALNQLICLAYEHNLTLRQAGLRILQARAELAISKGELLPQTQYFQGSFTQNAMSLATANAQFNTPLGPFALKQYYPQWNMGFGLNWELDFWGRFRRAIEANAAGLDASVADFDDVLVTLLGDVATNYVQYRTLEARIKYARDNVDLQSVTLNIAKARAKAGTVPGVDVDQAESTLAQTQAQIPELEISLRQSANRLCILIGIPPEEMAVRLGTAPIPTSPPDAIVGIPADLLRRRPDVRRAERQAASQSAQVGVAEADFYPHISIMGNLGYAAEQFKDLLHSPAFNAGIGPSFQWNIFNYGRLLNAEKLQIARFQESVVAYQQAVLTANEDVENGIVTFLKAQQRAKAQNDSVIHAAKAVAITQVQYQKGVVDLTRVTLLQQTLVQQQDTLAQAQGEIAQGLIHVYRALGGGWQLRCTGCPAGASCPAEQKEQTTTTPTVLPPPVSSTPENPPSTTPAGPRQRPAPQSISATLGR